MDSYNRAFAAFHLVAFHPAALQPNIFHPVTYLPIEFHPVMDHPIVFLPGVEAADNYQSYYLKNIHCNVNVTKDKKNLAKKEKKNGQTPTMNT